MYVVVCGARARPVPACSPEVGRSQWPVSGLRSTDCPDRWFGENVLSACLGRGLDQRVFSAIRFFVVFLLLSTASFIRADVSMSSLQSLSGVGVQIRGLPASTSVFALTEDGIADFVQRGLEKNGVRVLDREGIKRKPGEPVIEVTLNLVKVRGPSHLYTIDLELRETVAPVRELRSLKEIPAVTWKRQMAGIANRGSTVLDALEELIDDFGAEFRREN